MSHTHLVPKRAGGEESHSRPYPYLSRRVKWFRRGVSHSLAFSTTCIFIAAIGCSAKRTSVRHGVRDLSRARNGRHCAETLDMPSRQADSPATWDLSPSLDRAREDHHAHCSLSFSLCASRPDAEAPPRRGRRRLARQRSRRRGRIRRRGSRHLPEHPTDRRGS